MEFTSFKTHELVALSKSLGFVKYEAKDDEASFLAGSPIVSQILKEVCEELWKRASTTSNSPELQTLLDYGWPFIEAKDDKYQVVLHHLAKVKDWASFTDYEKVEIISSYVSPYKISADSINDILLKLQNF